MEDVDEVAVNVVAIITNGIVGAVIAGRATYAAAQ